MKIVLENSNGAFKKRYEKLLRDKEAELQLFSANLLNDEQYIGMENIRGGVYDDDGKLALLFLDANPFMLQLFGVNNSAEATKCLVNFIKANDISIKGILSPKADAELFLKAYNKPLKKGISMGIMTLTKHSAICANGKLVNPDDNDFEFVKTGIKRFVFDALHEELSDGKAVETAKKNIADKNFYIYENEEGIKTSFVKATERTARGKTLSQVFTYDEYRGRGYAKYMIKLVCDRILKTSEYVTLFVDLTNPISNRVYKDNGFAIISEVYEYSCE